MGIAQDIIDQTQAMQDDRHDWEASAYETSELLMPRQAEQFIGRHKTYPRQQGGAEGSRNAQKIVDPTGQYALDRFASAMESLICPRGSLWHGLTERAFEEPSDDIVQEHLDAVTRMLFTVRYTGRSQFSPSIGEVFRSLGALGNGVMYLGEGFDDAPVTYRTRAMGECYFAQNHRGVVDKLNRMFTLTARQAVQKWGEENLAGGIVAKANSTDEKERRFQFIHAVAPADEMNGEGARLPDQPFASFYVDVEHKLPIGRGGGYFEFPYIDFRMTTAPDTPYAEGPGMVTLPDLKMAQKVRTETLLSAEKANRPPLAAWKKSSMKRVNLNPGAVNYGAVTADGRPLLQPLNLGANPVVGSDISTQIQQQVNDAFYISLFQILLQNPNMTATEALLRAQEKGQLLGPIGGKIQSALARLIEREYGILSRLGFFDADGPVPAPPAARGRNFEVAMTSPLDKARRAEEGVGTMRTLDLASALAAAKPEVMDNIDADATLRGMADINGMPQSFLTDKTQVAEGRRVRAQQQAAQQAVAQVEAAAESAGKAAPAIQAIADARTA